MLKPSDKWSWYYDANTSRLMLDLGEDMVFQTNLPKKLLVDCGFGHNEFSVDDATSFQTYREHISMLNIDEYRQAELTLYCVAAKRFHKPVQPKSWFFDQQSCNHEPREGEIVQLSNSLGQGLFIVIEVGDNASLCACVDLQGFHLNDTKQLAFGESIKVMHDRMIDASGQLIDYSSMAMVG